MAGGVFFDLFGTLVVAEDLSGAWQRWLELIGETCAAAGVEHPSERLATGCRDFFDRPEPDDDGTGLTVYERRMGRLLNELGVATGWDTVRGVASESASAWRRHFAVDPEAAGVLAALSARWPLVLVSNFDHPPTARRALADSGLERYFAEVVISGEVGHKKPDPRIFTGPLERLGLRAAEVAHVGDAEEDVEGAVAAGVRPILVRRQGRATVPAGAVSDTGPRAEDDRRITVITSLGELLRVLR